MPTKRGASPAYPLQIEHRDDPLGPLVKMTYAGMTIREAFAKDFTAALLASGAWVGREADSPAYGLAVADALLAALAEEPKP